MCGYAFERPGQLAETYGKCPSCGVILQIPARGESVEDHPKPAARPSAGITRPRRAAVPPGRKPRRFPPWAWIALALVIFGGWNPVKAASGAYLFSFLQIMGIYFQEWAPNIPSQVFQVAPFPLMIFSLLIISLTQKKSILMWVENKRWMKFLFNFFSGMAPSALGKPYRPD